MAPSPRELFDAARTQVEKYARSICRRYGNRVDLDDLRQELLLVTWKSACSFDPARGVPWLAYMQQNISWHSLKVIFPKNLDDLSAGAQSLSQLMRTKDDGQVTLAIRVENFNGNRQLTDWHAADHFWARAAELIHLIETSPMFTPTERFYLHLQFVEGFDQPEVVRKVRRSKQYVNDVTRHGLRKLAQRVGVKDWRPPNWGGKLGMHSRFHRKKHNPRCQFCSSAA